MTKEPEPGTIEDVDASLQRVGPMLQSANHEIANKALEVVDMALDIRNIFRQQELAKLATALALRKDQL